MNKGRKAGVLTCLFLWFALQTQGQEWAFDANTQQAYELVLDLQTDEAHLLIPEPKTAQEHYVTALAEAIELLLTEDGEKYTTYEDRFEQRLEQKIKPNNADDLFLQAEIHFQWAFVYLKSGHEFDAALHFRQAYLTAQEVKSRFPKYKAIKKTSGLLEVIIGSIPEKYNWVLGLLSMQGSVSSGLADLESIRATDHPLAFEANLLYALIQGFVLQQTGPASAELKKRLQQRPFNRMVLFLGASLAIKNSASEEALGMLTTLADQHRGLPLYYTDYLRGEVYLHKAEYLNSITAYRSFINHYAGQNYIKDSYYKMGLGYWLNGNKNDALALFKEAKNSGKEASEADKHAARSLADVELPHTQLTKARFYTDGGYYVEAKKILEGIPSVTLPTKRDQVEYLYRKARLAHKTNDFLAAKSFYLETIETSGAEEWYFAPNSCLQLGYIALAQHDTNTAKTYFTRALSYKKHEYKNSIDTKAKSALGQPNDRK